jgi:LPS sulfotransferase NodH
LTDHAGSPASFAKAEQELEWLENYQRKATACANNAGALLTTCERAVQLLDRVLNLKCQQVAQQQNTAILALTKSTVDDSATVRVITAITLVYLSCTVVAVGYPFQ